MTTRPALPQAPTETRNTMGQPGWLPDPVGGILWWGNHTLNTSVAIPFYVGINELPKSQTTGSHFEFSRDSAFWGFNFVNSWAQLCWMGMYPDIRNLMNSLESEIMTALPAIDEKAYRIYQSETRYHKRNGKSHKNKCDKPEYKKTSEFLTGFCTDNAEYVLASWWDLADYLISNFDQGRYPRNNADGVRIAPSQEWLDAVSP